MIHPSNGLGCGESGRLWGADQQDRKSTAADLPHPPGLLESPGAPTGDVLGKLGICEQKEAG